MSKLVSGTEFHSSLRPKSNMYQNGCVGSGMSSEHNPQFTDPGRIPEIAHIAVPKWSYRSVPAMPG